MKIIPQIVNWKEIFLVNMFTKNMTNANWDGKDVTYFRMVELFVTYPFLGETLTNCNSYTWLIN